jgi:N utilization substance protein B
MPVAGRRHAARELALKMLFQVDIGRTPVADVLAHFVPDEEIGEPPAESIAYAHALVRGTAQNLGTIDGLLSGLAEEWTFDRLASVDRNVLRLAVFELLHGENTPEEVVINEAVELAKEYSTDESGKFVNGILGNLSRQRAAGTLTIEPELRGVDALPEPPEEEAAPEPVSESQEAQEPAPAPRRRRQSLSMTVEDE